MSHSTLKRQ